jgi:hypothetical protein
MRHRDLPSGPAKLEMLAYIHVGVHVCLWAPRSPGCLVFFMVDGVRSLGPEHHHLGYADP